MNLHTFLRLSNNDLLFVISSSDCSGRKWWEFKENVPR